MLAHDKKEKEKVTLATCFCCYPTGHVIGGCFLSSSLLKVKIPSRSVYKQSAHIFKKSGHTRGLFSPRLPECSKVEHFVVGHPTALITHLQDGYYRMDIIFYRVTINANPIGFLHKFLNKETLLL